MVLKTTTIGAYPKPACTPVGDWFMANKSEADRKDSKGLLSNWSPGEYEMRLVEWATKRKLCFLKQLSRSLMIRSMLG